MPGDHHSLKERALEELKTMFLIFIYLAVFLGVFMTYRRILLSEYRINYLHYGYAIIEALILSKVIMLGTAFRIGERFHNRPLIVPAAYKTACFSVLVFVFSFFEHLATGWYHGETTREVIDKILETGTAELMTRVLVIVFALIPFFAIREASRVMGRGKLYTLFFKNGRASESESPGQSMP